MTFNEFIVDALAKQQEALDAAIKDITPSELAWRPGPEANHIGWMLWHMFRVEDMWIQFFAQNQKELWEMNGWLDKFSLPARDNGFGHTAEQVARFPALDNAEVLKYGAAVRAATLKFVQGLGEGDFDTAPRPRRPDMTIGGMFRQLLGELYQHTGQIAYLRGLLRSGVGPGAAMPAQG